MAIRWIAVNTPTARRRFSGGLLEPPAVGYNALLTGESTVQLEGSIHNGAVVFDEATDLPDGTRVRVEPIAESPPPPAILPPGATPGRKPIASLQAIKARLTRERDNPSLRRLGPTLAEALAPFIGCLDGLPEDASTNHDYYIRHELPNSSEERS